MTIPACTDPPSHSEPAQQPAVTPCNSVERMDPVASHVHHSRGRSHMPRMCCHTAALDEEDFGGWGRGRRMPGGCKGLQRGEG